MRIRLLVNSDPGPAEKQYTSLTVNEKMNDLDTSSGFEKKKTRSLVREKNIFLSAKYSSLSLF